MLQESPKISQQAWNRHGQTWLRDQARVRPGSVRRAASGPCLLASPPGVWHDPGQETLLSQSYVVCSDAHHLTNPIIVAKLKCCPNILLDLAVTNSFRYRCVAVPSHSFRKIHQSTENHCLIQKDPPIYREPLSNQKDPPIYREPLSNQEDPPMYQEPLYNQKDPPIYREPLSNQKDPPMY
ncbi:hypothetical protein RRG08_000199 [Elysia crispata]|uniref:Uncharacterized protein n=1 Tax=Elysia crispata TaxID=231223 RepID=A0AAE0YWA2_9GAST|nr:hypothetical protein RRG08_000199 [Elysia crispata]